MAQQYFVKLSSIHANVTSLNSFQEIYENEPSKMPPPSTLPSKVNVIND